MLTAARSNASSDLPVNTPDTWPKVLDHNYRKYGDRYKAMRFKHYGIWQTYTWKDYYENVKYLALGLLALGFQAGDKLLIVGDNTPEWCFAELAAQCNRGLSTGLYAELSAAEIEYIARQSESRFVMAEDQEQVDKLVSLSGRLSRPLKIIHWRYKGLSHQNNQDIMGYRQVLQEGRQYEKKHPGMFEQNIAATQPDDICALVFTSGTTGQFPKGALHSYRSLMYTAQQFILHDHWEQRDNLAANLPPAWISEQWLEFGCHLLSGCVLNFAESAETQPEDIREIGPSLVLYSARLWERQSGRVQARLRAAGGLKKLAFRIFMPSGYRMADMAALNKKPGWFLKFWHFWGYWLLFRPLKDGLGLPHIRVAYSTGSILCPEAQRFYQALGVPLKNIYSSTEAGALAGLKSGDPGEGNQPAQAELEIKITPDGEIITRHPGIFKGYYNDPALTTQVFKDGWLHTGDAGYINKEGQLVYLDRLNDLIKMPGGDILYPQDIESRLKFSPYIKDAWVLAGPDQRSVCTIIIIDVDNTGRWADRRKVSYTTFTDLSQKPEVYSLIEQEITRLNTSLKESCRISRFVNLHKEFDPDESEMTHTRKLRKDLLRTKYAELVASLLAQRKSVTVEAEFTYQDGRVGKTKTELKIKTIGEGSG